MQYILRAQIVHYIFEFDFPSKIHPSISVCRIGTVLTQGYESPLYEYLRPTHRQSGVGEYNLTHHFFALLHLWQGKKNSESKRCGCILKNMN